MLLPTQRQSKVLFLEIIGVGKMVAGYDRSQPEVTDALNRWVWGQPRVLIAPNAASAMTVAVIDGPYDADALSGVLGRSAVSLGNNTCGRVPSSGCNHGTFVMGLLGASREAMIPGLCPGCTIIHVPLFVDEHAPSASVGQLANAINDAIACGARLINLSLGFRGDTQNDASLATALDCAEASGAVLVVAAGNQGRLVTGQLLSHPVTIPVVALDATGRLARGSNFGFAISRRGVAALGDEVPGYAPGGGTTAMSGTSAAAAIATGILAQVWSLRPELDGAQIRAAVARLAPRGRPVPPILDPDMLIAILEQTNPATTTPASSSNRRRTNDQNLQGGMIMNDRIGLARPFNRSAAEAAPAVTPAGVQAGCGCGAPGGMCTCGKSGSTFIYVLGSVDIRFPNQSISEELQSVANTLAGGSQQGLDPKLQITRHPGPEQELRNWQYRILRTSEARYVARQLSWILKVEGQPAYYLSLKDMHDLTDLTNCLSHPHAEDIEKSVERDYDKTGTVEKSKVSEKSEVAEKAKEPQKPASEDEPLYYDLNLFVGTSSLVPVEMSPGLALPVLVVDQLCSFNNKYFEGWFVPSRKTSLNPEPWPNRLFKTLVQSADNFGDTDEWRALNYLACRYLGIYDKYEEMKSTGYELVSVNVMTSRLSRDKHIVDPVFTFRNSNGGVRKWFVRVDVSHLFPMVVYPLSEYFDR